MRTLLSTAAAAVLSIAAPAAAQPDAHQILLDAFQKMDASHPSSVDDYSFTLSYEGLRLPMYVYRAGDGWEVAPGEDSPLGQLLQVMVAWPSFVDDGFGVGGMEGVEAEADIAYLGTDTVGGRPTHAVSFRMLLPGSFGDTRVDSMRVHVDTENDDVLRVHVSGALVDAAEADFTSGGQMNITVDMLEHAVTEGLRIPRRLRLRMQVGLQNVDPAELAQMRQAMPLAMSQIQGNDEGAREIRTLLELASALLEGEEVDISALVKNVVVNPGPPDPVK